MLPTQPQSIGGLIDAGVKLFRNTFADTMKVALVSALPYALSAAMMNQAAVGLEEQADPNQVLAQTGAVFFWMPIVYLLLCFTLGAVIHCQASLNRGEQSALGESLAVGLRRMFPLTVLLFLYILAMTFGMILLLIPGLIVMVTLALFFYASFFEDVSVWRGLGRSHQLVWGGNFWRTAIVLTMMGILGIALSALTYVIGGVIAVVDPARESTLSFFMEVIAGWISMALFLPITSAVGLALYNDLVLRKEGDDLGERLADASAE